MDETLETYSKNVSRLDRDKAAYRELLGVLTHRELLEYAVNKLNYTEDYERKAILVVVEKNIAEAVSNRNR